MGWLDMKEALCSAKIRSFTDVVLTQRCSLIHIHDVARLRPVIRQKLGRAPSGEC
jgi:hypothetical protein